MSQCRRLSNVEHAVTKPTSPANDPIRLTGLMTLRQRRTCALAWAERRTHAEIGAAHGVSHWASKKRVQRARRKLRAAGIVPPGGHAARRRTPAFQLNGIENV